MADPFDKFIGIPFRERGRALDGADCWGLFRLALLLIADLDLPSYDEHYSSVREREVNARMIRGGAASWLHVQAGREQRFDGVLMRDGRYDSHIGLVVRPGYMLHTYQGGTSCIDRYRNSPFRERLVGFYRHQAFGGQA